MYRVYYPDAQDIKILRDFKTDGDSELNKNHAVQKTPRVWDAQHRERNFELWKKTGNKKNRAQEDLAIYP